METGRTGGAAASGEAQRTTRHWEEKKTGGQAAETGENGSYFARTAATFCGDCLALTLGAATTLSLALLQGGAVLADVCWRAIRKSCCDNTGSLCRNNLETSPLLPRTALEYSRQNTGQEVHARGHCKPPFHKNTPENSDTRRIHARLESVSLHSDAASSPLALAASCALRRQENTTARAHRVEQRVGSARHAQPSSTHGITTHISGKNTAHAVKGTLYMKSNRLSDTRCISHRMPLLVSYTDGQELHGCWRGRRQRSCCGRSLSGRGNSSSREAASDVAAVSLFNGGGVRDSNHRREVEPQGICCSSAVKGTPIREGRARPGIVRQDTTTFLLAAQWKMGDILGKERWCMGRGKEAARRSGGVCQEEPFTTAGGVYSIKAPAAQKPTSCAESLARRTALGSLQSSSRAAGGDAGSLGEPLNVTAEQLQRTAEQVFLWSSSAASRTTSPARGEARAREERCEGEETAMRYIGLPWERVSCLLHQWKETLVNSSEFVSLKFTSFPLIRVTEWPRKKFSGRTSSSSTRKEAIATQHEAARVAEIATPCVLPRNTNWWRGGATGEAAIESSAGADTNVEGQDSNISSIGEKNTHLSRACVGKSVHLALPCVAEKSGASRMLSFYPPLFVKKEVMSFRLPWHELRSDITCPFFGTTAQCDGSGTEEPTDKDSEIPKPRFWGRFFCLRNFSPIAKARAQLELGVGVSETPVKNYRKSRNKLTC